MHTEKQRILLVDDDEMVRDLMFVRLTQKGYAVTAAENGKQALDRLEHEKFDLVLLDIVMPVLNGLDVLKEIRKSYSMLHLPVIMATADDQEDCIVSALELGANDYLVKPINIKIAYARINAQITLKQLAEVKDEFLSFASHDLKKPLMLMLDIAQTINQQLNDSNPPLDCIKGDINLMTRSGTNMMEVIESFLNQTTMSQGQLVLNRSIIDTNKIIEKVVKENIVYAKKKGISLRVELEDTPNIKGDQLRIEEVLDNLIGNAIKFSPGEAEIIVRSFRYEDCIRIEVDDSGPGLMDEDMEKLFVKHAKLSNKPTGNETSSSVGLAICKQFIELHDGQIGAHNNDKYGATFWFTLPV